MMDKAIRDEYLKLLSKHDRLVSEGMDWMCGENVIDVVQAAAFVAGMKDDDEKVVRDVGMLATIGYGELAIRMIDRKESEEAEKEHENGD